MSTPATSTPTRNFARCRTFGRKAEPPAYWLIRDFAFPSRSCSMHDLPSAKRNNGVAQEPGDPFGLTVGRRDAGPAKELNVFTPQAESQGIHNPHLLSRARRTSSTSSESHTTIRGTKAFSFSAQLQRYNGFQDRCSETVSQGDSTPDLCVVNLARTGFATT